MRRQRDTEQERRPASTGAATIPRRTVRGYRRTRTLGVCWPRVNEAAERVTAVGRVHDLDPDVGVIRQRPRVDRTVHRHRSRRTCQRIYRCRHLAIVWQYNLSIASRHDLLGPQIASEVSRSPNPRDAGLLRLRRRVVIHIEAVDRTRAVCPREVDARAGGGRRGRYGRVGGRNLTVVDVDVTRSRAQRANDRLAARHGAQVHTLNEDVAEIKSVEQRRGYRRPYHGAGSVLPLQTGARAGSPYGLPRPGERDRGIVPLDYRDPRRVHYEQRSCPGRAELKRAPLELLPSRARTEQRYGGGPRRGPGNEGDPVQVPRAVDVDRVVAGRRALGACQQVSGAERRLRVVKRVTLIGATHRPDHRERGRRRVALGVQVREREYVARRRSSDRCIPQQRSLR